MEQIIQQYIQAKGLNEQQAQQLIQELQQLDEQQLQQVIGNMQQQLGGDLGEQPTQEEVEMMQYGGIPVSMDGLYEYENTPVIVPNGNITMENIPYEVDAYDADSGEFLQTMQPNQNYQFDVDNVLEVPKGKFGISKMQAGGSKSFYENYLDKYAPELDELEILKSNKQAGYLNFEQSKRLLELQSKHSKFNKDFKRVTKSNTISPRNNDFSPEEEKEFNQLLKQERADKRKLTIAENKRLEQLKAEQERLDALKPLTEKPLKRKKTYASGTINQIREENAKYLEEAKKRDAELEKRGFQFKPKSTTKEPVNTIKPLPEQLIPNQKQDPSIVLNQAKVQGRGESIKLLSDKLKDPTLTKVQRDAIFLELQKLTRENTVLPKSSKFDLKKSAINVGENVLDAVEGLARNKWIRRASDVAGTIGGVVGGGLAALDIYNTAEEGRGSVGALEFLNDNSPLGKKYQKLYEERLNKDSIWNSDTINRELGNAYYQEKLKQSTPQQKNTPSRNELVSRGNTPITNYFQPNNQLLPNNFNSNLTDSTSQYSGNTPVEAIGNPNLRTGDRVDTVGGKPVKDFGISNKTDKFGFVSRLKGEKTSKQDNINDYKTWVKDWSTKIDGFDKLPYANQQMVAMQWVKAQRPDVYDGLKKQWEAKGYNKNGKGFEGFLNDGMYANITSSLRPSTLTNNEEPVPNFVDANLPVESGNSQPINYTGTVDENPISLPNQNDDDEELDMKDVVLGKLNNKDYSGQFLSNMKLRNNNIKMPYFGRVDLKNPSLYTQNISPYLNQLYAANNTAKQNLDMNSAVGQSAQIQLGANMLDRINDVSGKVYNTNMQQTVNWENTLADIYNKQQQMDEGNRRQYDDDVNRIIANKQNVDSQIDKMAYEFKQTGVRNKNNMLLSQMLHPNYIIQDDGTMVRKGEQFNKGYNEYLEEEMKRLKEENEKLKAKYGIRKKK